MLFLVIPESCRNSALVELALAHAVVINAIGRHAYTRLRWSFNHFNWLLDYLSRQFLLLNWWRIIHNDNRVLLKPMILSVCRKSVLTCIL